MPLGQGVEDHFHSLLLLHVEAPCLERGVMSGDKLIFPIIISFLFYSLSYWLFSFLDYSDSSRYSLDHPFVFSSW